MKGYPYLQYVNKYHENGDKSTIVALNMLNGMYHNHKITYTKHLFFPKCNQTRKEGDEKSDLSYLITNIQNFTKK
jgi:hypothetical protein